MEYCVRSDSSSPRLSPSTLMTRPSVLIACLSLAACTGHPSTSAPGPQATFDVVLENGRVIDGTGAAWFPGDVGDHRRPHRAHRRRADRSAAFQRSSASMRAGSSSRRDSSTSRAAYELPRRRPRRSARSRRASPPRSSAKAARRRRRTRRRVRRQLRDRRPRRGRGAYFRARMASARGSTRWAQHGIVA